MLQRGVTNEMIKILLNTSILKGCTACSSNGRQRTWEMLQSSLNPAEGFLEGRNVSTQIQLAMGIV